MSAFFSDPRLLPLAGLGLLALVKSKGGSRARLLPTPWEPVLFPPGYLTDDHRGVYAIVNRAKKLAHVGRDGEVVLVSATGGTLVTGLEQAEAICSLLNRRRRTDRAGVEPTAGALRVQWQIFDVLKRGSTARLIPPRQNPPPLESFWPKHLADFSEFYMTETQAMSLVSAAASGTPLVIIGEGRSMVARRFPALLGPMSTGLALKVDEIYQSVRMGTMDLRPFRAPHYTVGDDGLFGKSRLGKPIPGEVQLANGGVLYLDEANSFSQPVLRRINSIEDSDFLLRELDVGSAEDGFHLIYGVSPDGLVYLRKNSLLPARRQLVDLGPSDEPKRVWSTEELWGLTWKRKRSAGKP